MRKMLIYNKGKKIAIFVNETGFLGKIMGLMFKSSSTKPILFSFSKKKIMHLHSFFVLFDFLVLWIDEHGKVVDYFVASPFMYNISSRKKCAKILEIPKNMQYKKIWDFFVGNKKI